MVKGSKLSAEMHWVVVRLSSILKSEDIAMYTGISISSVQRILRYFDIHGTINHKDEERKRRQNYLRDMDVEVHNNLS